MADQADKPGTKQPDHQPDNIEVYKYGDKNLDAPAYANGLKEAKASKAARVVADVRSFYPSSVAIARFLWNLALFFFKCNIALHLIEHPNLVAACAAMGVLLPGRKKLATTMLDNAYKELAYDLRSGLRAVAYP
ncbi:hypothetical protein VOLCADRAFT_93267 [Volvox carteri f. nagariensis]|uniref:Uncharacterized protein n=1 Tax=Volvox carteri f. nagariensis TaxID=3068 RepID=D8U1P3_VOLCA|nr:uncharacterized protein VOLCADRAFT_93267 [Volvox carteri f. nagariensis]EFJ46376.1 hypothetical protein VOLCADRAFT_93267 [Volvox carteri f. nagariensis]|eukprot:XP_002952529.1 hypothetical protein VOLCADRAFT_93267 [Volvox carteri f. nagariensis]